MKTAIALSIGFWTAVAVWGFWGWAASCTAGAVALWYLGKEREP